MRALKDYSAYIFDLDGTLYHQMPVQVFMAVRLAVHYGLRPYRFRELLALREYRRLRERCFGVEREDFGNVQLEESARLSGLDVETVRKVVASWLGSKALGAVRMFRRRELLEAMRGLQAAGKIVAVYSDYPVKDKLRAMGFAADYAYWSGDEMIRCMKPDCAGLVRILEALGLGRECVLYVGDRDDRDGVCAEGAGVDYIDVKEFCRRI